jgi:hypothetical protein
MRSEGARLSDKEIAPSQNVGLAPGTAALVRVTGSEDVGGRKHQCRDHSKDGLQVRAHDSFRPIDFGET